MLQRSLPPIRLLVQGIDAETSGEDEDAAADGDVQGFAAPSVRHADGFEEASVVVGQRIGALVVSGEAFFLTQRNQLVELAAQHAIPTIYAYREFPIAGGLMSYGGDYTEPLVCSEYTPAEFSRGEKPADLPIQQATKVELVINLKTAKTLGLAIPLPLLGRADLVIE